MDQASSLRILVAEDNPVSSRILLRALGKHGYEAKFVKDGIAAWEEVSTGSYQILITDWMMPGLEGPELCRRIRDSDLPFCYIIVITAKTANEDKMNAILAGADDFLTKPFNEADLVARLAAGGRLVRLNYELQRINGELTARRDELATMNERLVAQQEELKIALKRLEEASWVADISRDRFSQLFEGLPLPCFTIGMDGLVYEWNAEAATRFGVPPHLAIGRTPVELLGSNLIDERAVACIEGAAQGMAFAHEDWNDGCQYFFVSGYPLFGSSGQVTGAILTLADVTPQRLAEAKLEEQLKTINELYEKLQAANQRLASIASLDGLTGIPNHRTFQERLAAVAEMFEQGGEPFVLALVDIDHFKKFNDEFGHLAGDEVLKQVAETLNNATRDSDVVARYGGEEFAALFRNATIERATTLAERLRAAVESIPPKYRPVTISVGLAEYGEDIGTTTELVSRADAALYAAKNAGRNCVRSWTRELGAQQGKAA